MRWILPLLVCAQVVSAQATVLLEENFAFTGLLTANGWTAVAGTGSNAITAAAPSLVYPNLPSSGVGNAASLTITGEDNRKIFAATASDIYTSCLINVSAAKAAGDYFYSLSSGTTGWVGRLFARSSGAGFQLGIQKSSTGPPTYFTSELVFGTTYLVVIKVTKNTGTTSDDTASLWINPALGSAETTQNATATAGNDQASIDSIILRQGSSANAPTVRVGNILVGTTWSSVTPANDSDGDGLTDAWEQGHGRYQVIEGNFTWEQAKADAQTRGGHLATITSAAESNFIYQILGATLGDNSLRPSGLENHTWLGATDNDTEGDWRWVTGERWSFTNWGPPEPNNGPDANYLTLFNSWNEGHTAGLTWNDDQNTATESYRYLLEFGYPTDPNKADTDGDGYNDKRESQSGTDPNDATSYLPDSTAPAITLIGDNPQTVYRGTVFSDLGATVTDDFDATRTITGTGTVDTSTVGTYTLTYATQDEVGNVATPVTRTVNVVLNPTGDEDNDGLNNTEEANLGTNPYQRDTDSDGVNDLREAGDHTDPLDPASFDSLSQGLVAYYPFNGNANDESGNGINGIVYGATLSTDRSGAPNRAYSFNGVDPNGSYIDFGRPANLQFAGDFTATAWAMFQGGTMNPRVISYGQDPGFELLTVGNGGRRQILAYAGIPVFSSATFEENAWHMLTVVRSGGVATLYVNGLPVGSEPISQSGIYNYNFQIGKKSGNITDHWGGKIDEVRIYNRGLAGAEVALLYANELYAGFGLEGAATKSPFDVSSARNWSSGGAEWSVDTTTTHDGVDSVKAKTTNGQSTYREYTVTGPKVVDFWWKVSSEQGFDTFSYFVNGVNQETISGEVDWSYRTLTLPEGTHTIRWTYAKDASDAVGQDAGWLDDFAVYPATPTLRVRDGSTVLNGTVTVDFGDADIGSAGFTKSLNLANEGYVPQEVELSLPPSSPFTFEGGSSTYVTLIGRGESVNVPIYLATQSTGTKTALLSISALNSTAAPPQVTLTGDVRGPVVGVSLGSTTLTSGQTVDMGLAPKILEFTIRNNGNTGNLTPQVSATGNFQIVQQPAASVAPQGSTTFKVMAQSGVFGSQTGSVVVTSNDGFTPTFTINLTSKVFFGIGSGISEGSVATSGTSGASGWDFATTQLPSGSTGQAIKTGVTPDNGKSHLQAIFNGAGLLRWKWKLSAQEGFDWLACEVSNPASNSTYLDSLRDDSLSGTGGTIDIVSMSIDETTDHLIFAITVNGNTAAYGGNGGPLYFIAIATGEGANVFDKFNVSTPLGRTTHYISTVIYGGTLAQAWISNSSEGIPVELVTGPQTTLRYMVRKTLLNYKRGNSFYFDAYSAWQDEFGGNRFAMDSLSNPQVASGETYTSTPEKGISRYPRGGEVASLSTKNSVWREQVVYVPAGGCVKWTYRKDGSAAVGEDAGYIADLVFEPFEAPLSYSDWWRQFQQPSTNTNIQTIFTTNCVVTAVGPAFITNCYVMPISITNVTVSYPDPPHPQAPMSRSGLPALMSWVGGFNPDSVPDSSHYRILQDGSQQKFRFPISKRYSGGSVSAEFTPSLTNNWSGAGVRQTLHSQDANTVIIEATPPAGASNGFMRLNVR